MSLAGVFRKYQGDRTQTEYAEFLGLTQGTLSLIYSGRRGVGMEVLRALARAYPESAEDIASALSAPEREIEAVAS